MKVLLLSDGIDPRITTRSRRTRWRIRNWPNTAVYENVTDALADLKALEELHEDQMIGKYDAAVIDQKEGKPHIVKRMDRPRVRVIPEALGSGRLPRKELKEATGAHLDGGRSDRRRLTNDREGLRQGSQERAKIVKRSVDATTGRSRERASGGRRG